MTETPLEAARRKYGEANERAAREGALFLTPGFTPEEAAAWEQEQVAAVIRTPKLSVGPLPKRLDTALLMRLDNDKFADAALAAARDGLVEADWNLLLGMAVGRLHMTTLKPLLPAGASQR